MNESTVTDREAARPSAGFDFATLERERVASQCVCCGSRQLQSSPAILMPFIAHRVFGWKPVLIDASWGLKSIASGMAYSICQSLFCADCGLLFLDIRFSGSELGKLYADYRGVAYNALRESYEPGYAQRNSALNAGIDYVEAIERFLAPHLVFPLSILDWGGDTGKNTPFKNRNDVFDIYDIGSKPVVEGARRVSREEAFSRRYRLIVCSNVLEHVPFPSDLLFDIKNCMDSASVLYIEVPFEDVSRNEKTDLHLKKRHWHEHVNFYSETSLRRLLENCGLLVVAIKQLNASAGGNSAFLFQIACKLQPT